MFIIREACILLLLLHYKLKDMGFLLFKVIVHFTITLWIAIVFFPKKFNSILEVYFGNLNQKLLLRVIREKKEINNWIFQFGVLTRKRTEEESRHLFWK
jgi:hypothetical protein